jgi:hypothetical protein
MTNSPPAIIHFTLQGKGGVGKSLVSWHLAQYLKDAGRQLSCFDTDPMNRTFSQYKALKVTEVAVLKGNDMNIDALDGLVDKVLLAPGDVVVDNGAASFAPVSDYLISNEITDMAAQHGKLIMAHVPLVGGGNAMDTARGLKAILEQFPESVKVVVWINEFFGPVEVDGQQFEDGPIYEEHKARIAGIITIPALDPRTFGNDLSKVLRNRSTFQEAFADTDLMIVPRQRLTMIQRGIAQQLQGIV